MPVVTFIAKIIQKKKTLQNMKVIKTKLKLYLVKLYYCINYSVNNQF